MKTHHNYKIFFLFLLLIPQMSFGQDNTPHRLQLKPKVLLAPQIDFTGLIGYSYLEVDGENNPITINKPLYIIYNNQFCKLSIGGLITYFDIDPSYTRELIDSTIVESFINSDAETIRRGWYSIRIEHNKANSATITINMPMYTQGKALVVNKSKIYSEHGEVKGEAKIGNWKELEDKKRELDSIKTHPQIQINKMDCVKGYYKKPDFIEMNVPKTTIDISEFINKGLSDRYKIDTADDIGTLYFQLTISTTGKIDSIKLLDQYPLLGKKYYNASFINEVKDIAYTMPPWQPATLVKNEKPTTGYCSVKVYLGSLHMSTLPH